MHTLKNSCQRFTAEEWAFVTLRLSDVGKGLEKVLTRHPACGVVLLHYVVF